MPGGGPGNSVTVDVRQLAALASVPRAGLDAHLISAERFLRGELPVRLETEVRGALLDRFGIFGVRLAATLVRSGFDSRVKLSAELIRRSGLTELRESVTRCFIDRRDTLKARSALAAVETLLRAEPTRGSDELVGGVEQILAGAHEFRELRLLVALRNTRLGFDVELADEAQRLIGGNGVGLAARLGVEHEATAQRLWRSPPTRSGGGGTGPRTLCFRWRSGAGRRSSPAVATG